jgi:tetratricopeptide (TPR) repeat protein
MADYKEAVKMKRIISSLIAVAFILGLCSCGQKASTWQEQYDLGIRYMEEGSYEEAIIAFTAAIEIDPKQAATYVSRGDAYVQSGETDEILAAALADYEQAVKLDKVNPDAYLGIADVYIRMNEYDKALEILQQGLENTEEAPAIADKIAEVQSTIGEDTVSESTPESAEAPSEPESVSEEPTPSASSTAESSTTTPKTTGGSAAGKSYSSFDEIDTSTLNFGDSVYVNGKKYIWFDEMAGTDNGFFEDNPGGTSITLDGTLSGNIIGH